MLLKLALWANLVIYLAWFELGFKLNQVGDELASLPVLYWRCQDLINLFKNL